ncbi:YuzB family protein [Paenibacillus sp. J23TS9]|uniref:YuzB family protein n=1 Tax=Paenibacillus dokdonensis TaxID=2567944 RepID=A0ABU6GQ12_9BACL|nr:YuzB family protein [Paenibacillus dokdonensis]MEC0241800.1 YuzB family protein [Paenibacillus dokdonensis]GIP29875.1 YuzB family protein [Paenibacillus sp. J23TS9]
MRPIIEFCTNNMHFGTDEVMDNLEENPDYDVIEYGCLSNCGQCAMMPFAMVNGEIIDADSADELYQAIMAKIKELEAWDSLELD